MRLKGILLAFIVLAALAAFCGSLALRPMFDMSKWTTDTYPAFGPSGSLYNAAAPRMPSASSSGVDLGELKYSPMFDMSPGAFSFNTYPAFTGSGSQGTGMIFGMVSGKLSRSF